MREKEGICINVREKEEGQNKDIVLVCKHAGEKSMCIKVQEKKECQYNNIVWV